MEVISHRDAKNVYYARYQIQRHYENETYFLQIDSHIRFTKFWDTGHIKMIHDCDAREKSIITVYPCNYSVKEGGDGWDVDIKTSNIV